MSIKKLINVFFHHSLIKQSAIVLTGSMFTNISAWLYHVLVGRVLGIERYGELAALLSLFYIINVPGSVLQTMLVKFFTVTRATGQDGQTKRLLMQVTRKVIVVLILGFACVSFFAPFIGSYFKFHSNMYIIWLYLIFGTFLLSAINGSILQSYQMFSVIGIFTNIGMVLRLVLGVLFAYWGVGWTLISNIVSNGIMYIVSFLPLQFVLKLPEQKLSFTKGRVITYSIPVFFTTLGVTALYSQDVLLVKHFFSDHAAGTYAALSIVGKIIFFATAAIGFVLFPVVSERKEKKESSATVVYLGLGIISLVCLVSIGFYFIFPSFVVGLFGKTFREAIPYMGKFAIFISFFSLSSVLIQVLLALEKKFTAVCTMLAAGMQLILINFYHSTISSVINVNIGVSATLFIMLFMYYLYES